MRRELPIHSNEARPDELVRLFHFGRTESELAHCLGVSVSQVKSWKAGTEPVPPMAVRLLRVIDSGNTLRCAGPWNGSRADGDRLHIEAVGLSLDFAELDRLATYRRQYHLGTLQAELIERLMIERDFYRDQCHQQARFGMVLNQLFPSA